MTWGVEYKNIKKVKFQGSLKKYNCNKLLYFEEYSDVNQAIEREKKIKKLSRINKDLLIDKINSKRNDLFEILSLRSV